MDTDEIMDVISEGHQLLVKAVGMLTPTNVALLQGVVDDLPKVAQRAASEAAVFAGIGFTKAILTGLEKSIESRIDEPTTKPVSIKHYRGVVLPTANGVVSREVNYLGVPKTPAVIKSINYDLFTYSVQRRR